VSLENQPIIIIYDIVFCSAQIEEKDRILIELKAEIAALENRVKHAEYQKSLELSAQSQKWEEFGRLAESMRTLSSTMAHNTTPRSKLQL
jgi:hypothetical protein